MATANSNNLVINLNMKDIGDKIKWKDKESKNQTTELSKLVDSLTAEIL